MVDKKNIKCIRKTYVGPFWDNYLVYVHVGKQKTKIYYLRIMKKPLIVKYEEEKLIQYEYYVRNRIRHKNIINILYSFQDYDHLYYISEYAAINLVQFLKLRVMFSRKTSIFYIAEIILGIQYLHSKEHVFGFICPKTVLINNKGHIKLRYDFLNAIEDRRNGVNTYIEFTSPEYIFEGKIIKESDYWGIGILLYYMLAGYTPFCADSRDKVVKRIKNEELTFPIFLDDATQDLITKLLEKDPSKRLCGLEIREHPVFKDIDWDELENQTIEPPFIFDDPGDNEYINAKLNDLYTTDFYPGQKDGYGTVFRYFGRMDVQNPYG